jgi:N-acetylglucosamine kinase-like BadF-type ATPase
MNVPNPTKDAISPHDAEIRWLVGIDGGGTRGRFVLSSAQGALREAHQSASLNWNNIGTEAAKANLQAGFHALGLSSEDRAHTMIHAGIAGVRLVRDCADYADLISEATGVPRAQIHVHNDIEPLLLGGLSGNAGIALIMGTGSHAMGRSFEGRLRTCGGWGYLLDDAGSGYAIGYETLRLAARMWDGRVRPTPMADGVREVLGIVDPDEVLVRVYNEGYGFADINQLARHTVQWAIEGDSGARAVVEGAARDGVELITTLVHYLDMPDCPLVVTGGIIEQPIVREAFVAALAEKAPGVHLRPSDYPPVAGAVIGAAMDAALPVDDTFLSTLRASLAILDPVI